MDKYTYTLPEERIARFPLSKRSGSRLLIYDRGNISRTTFDKIAEYAGGENLIIFNNTRVIQARILMQKETGSTVEIFLLEPLSPAEHNLAFTATSGCLWKCMVGNKKRWKKGKLNKKLFTDKESAVLSAEVVKDHGAWQEIRFEWKPSFYPFSKILDSAGLTPIPPYLGRLPVEEDKRDYQTVYSKFEGSVAAPTAGLHFTRDIIEELINSGALTGEITLHVGAGTFQPVKSATAGEHPMHAERFTAGRRILELLRDNSGRITAVGTTSLRTIESLYWLGVKLLQKTSMDGPDDQTSLSKSKKHGLLFLSQWEHLSLPPDVPVKEAINALITELDSLHEEEINAKTELMITPGYNFRMTDRLITNFHQPGSTLLILIAAFIGDGWRKVYDYALKNNFRFLSYGDSSLLIPKKQ